VHILAGLGFVDVLALPDERERLFRAGRLLRERERFRIGSTALRYLILPAR